MRNLQQVLHRTYAFDGGCHSCYRSEHVVVVKISEGNMLIQQLGSTGTILASFDVPDISPDQADSIVDLQYLGEEDSLCIIMKGGDIVIVRLGAAAEPGDAVLIIGSVDQTILAAQWSPDHEILAILSATSISLLTSQFETLAMVAFTGDDLAPSSKQVSVGWGRSETQFRGRDIPRDPTLPLSIDRGDLSKDDAADARISWRGDAQYFSTSTIEQDRRVIRVYSRDGVMESASEPVNGHESLLSWKHDGSLIFTTQRKTHGSRQCIMFEKNGLRHGEFDLRDPGIVLDLQWNSDGSVLAVRYGQHIDFWTTSNYHYSLKFRVFTINSVEMKWHSTDALRLIITSVSAVTETRFCWHVTSQEPAVPHDFGVVAVVDGCTLGLTPMRLANVPPPMSYRSVQLLEIPRDVKIYRDAKLIVILNSKDVQVYQWNLETKPIQRPQLRTTIQFSTEANVVPLQIEIDDRDRYHILLSSSALLHIEGTEISKSACIASEVYSIHHFDNDLFTQTEHGKIALHGSTDILKIETGFCANVSIAKINNEIVAFSLSDSGRLFANASVIAKKATSLLVVGQLLLYTTSTHLKFIHLRGVIKDIEDELHDDERSRQIERGSLLICSCPSAQSITLQAPRGNLETIYPRLLVLMGIREAISAGRWRDAWQRAKIHRVNTNIMCDHDPGLFLNNLGDFIAGLQTSLELDVFLTGLKPEDVSRTLYADTCLDVESSRAPCSVFGNKTNEVCEKVLQYLEAHLPQSHLMSLLTASLSKDPPDFLSALDRISSLKGGQLESAITHMCFLGDSHVLYNEALGLYDLPLALQFAQRSQKDPREYVPFLQSIQQMSSGRQKFTLDDYLNRYDKALESLLQSDSLLHESILYIQKHGLWQTGLRVLRHDRHRYELLMKSYAEHLFQSQEFGEAGFAFDIVKKFDRAAEAFGKAGLWPEALSCTMLAGLSPVEMAQHMAQQMMDQSRYSEAAAIYHEYLHDDESAVKMYCKAYQFDQAILLARGQVDILVRSQAIEAFVQTSELLSDMRAQLRSQLPRLREVRRRRYENPESFLDDMIEDDAPDNISLTGSQSSTSTSIFTRYTGTTAMTNQTKQSSKARRRQERQRAKGRKGTIWEEEYLVNSFRRLVERLRQTREEAQKLVRALVRCGLIGNATELQTSAIDLIDLVRSDMEEVFQGILTLPDNLQRSIGPRPVLEKLEAFRLC